MASGYRSFCRSARDLVTVCRAIDGTGTAAECDALASLLDKLESELDEPFFSVDPEAVYDRAAALYTRVADRDTPTGDARFHFKAMKSTLAQLSHNEEYIAAATAYNQKAAGFPMNLFCRQAVLPH